jgi:hypothetical protein
VQEEQLVGGVANAGQVVRVGDHVLRPSTAYTQSIHAFLRGLRESGFNGAPMPIGVDDDGRERLVFIEGAVPVPPYPEWAQQDEALASAAAVLAELHHRSRGFNAGEFTWSPELADPAGGTTMCHNDVCLENIVFQDGIAVGLLDFEFCAPGRPVFDVAQFARMCVPVDDEASAARLGWHHADRPARLRLVADVYGFDQLERTELLTLLDTSAEQGGAFVRRRVEAGDENFIAMWNAMGGAERFERRRRWWAETRAQFELALR